MGERERRRRSSKEGQDPRWKWKWTGSGNTGGYCDCVLRASSAVRRPITGPAPPAACAKRKRPRQDPFSVFLPIFPLHTYAAWHENKGLYEETIINSGPLQFMIMIMIMSMSYNHNQEYVLLSLYMAGIPESVINCCRVSTHHQSMHIDHPVYAFRSLSNFLEGLDGDRASTGGGDAQASVLAATAIGLEPRWGPTESNCLW